MKLFLCLMVLIFTVSCSSTVFNPAKEEVVKVAAETYASGYAFLFTCGQEELIKKDAMIYLSEKIKFLQASVESKSVKGIGKELCIAAIEGIFPKLIDAATKKTKPEYECTGEFLGNASVFLATKVCEKIKI